MTGCAAVVLNCDAITLHSWAGIGRVTSRIPKEEIANKVAKNFFKKKNWAKTRVLIVDEISMMSKWFFELLDMIGKRVRKSTAMFGGIQLVFSGDFYQLPPVGDQFDKDTSSYCFKSDLWREAFPKSQEIELVTSFRHKNDKEYDDMLRELRVGKLSEKSIKYIKHIMNETKREKEYPNEIHLFSTNREVDEYNMMIHNSIPGEEYVYRMERVYMSDAEMCKKGYTKEMVDKEFDYLIKSLVVNEVERFKIGSTVMSIINKYDDDGRLILCNGSMGIVVAISMDGYPIIEVESDGKKTQHEMTRAEWSSDIMDIKVTQVSIKSSKGQTVHKSQGSTKSGVLMGEIGKEVGESYVGMSRGKMKVKGKLKVREEKEVCKYYSM
jgi:ATP-dependent DNA helicase PIF1